VAYLGASLSMRFLGLTEAQRQHTHAGIELCETHGLMAWLPILKLSQATLATQQPDRESIEAGIEDILECYNMWTDAGAGMFTPWFNYEVAAAKLALGDLTAAENYLERAKQCCRDNDEHWLEPDVLCLEAALNEASETDPETVSQMYAAATTSARAMGANLAGRKTSLAHARFLAGIGNRQKALDVLRDADNIVDSARNLSLHHEEKELIEMMS